MNGALSKLRGRTNALSGDKKKRVEGAISCLYPIFRRNGENVSLDDSDMTYKARRITANDMAQVVVKYTDGQFLHDIAVHYGWSDFDALAVICDYAFHEQPKGSRLVDLTSAIEFVGLAQENITAVLEYLLNTRNSRLVTKDFVVKLDLMTHHSMLSLVILKLELKNRTMADLFERNWATLDRAELITPEQAAEDRRLFDEMWEEVARERREAEARPWQETNAEVEQLAEEVQALLRNRKDYFEVIELKVKECADTLVGRPAVKVETISSDDDDEPEGDDVLVVDKTSRKGACAAWLGTELTSDDFERLAQVREGEFYYVRLPQFQPKPGHFVLGKVVRAFDNSQYRVKTEGREDEVVGLSHLALKDSHKLRYPEGTRVIARYELTRGSPVQKAGWYSGIVGMYPMGLNSLEYLIFFDDRMYAYVDPENVRLRLEQPINRSTQQFAPRLSFIFAGDAARIDFIRSYLEKWPEWPLIKARALDLPQRILVGLHKAWNGRQVLLQATTRNGQRTSAHILEVDRQLCLVRFPRHGAVSQSGEVCLKKDCQDHDHDDEWLYRGDTQRFPLLKESVNPTPLRVGQQRRRVGGAQFDAAWPQNQREIPRPPTAERQHNRARKGTKERRTEPAQPLQAPVREKETKELKTLKQRANKTYVKNLQIPSWNILERPSHAKCTPECIRKVCGQSLHKEERYKIHSPYMKPMFFGWSRIKYTEYLKCPKNGSTKREIHIAYRAPCGRRCLGIEAVATYLQLTNMTSLTDGQVTIDTFVFDEKVCPQRLSYPVKDTELRTDFSGGQEEMPIRVVNAVNKNPIPQMTYRTQRTTKHKHIQDLIHPTYCSGCSCTDNCADPDKCECQRVTREMAERLEETMQPRHPGYEFKVLVDTNRRVRTGVFECNSLCACSGPNERSCFNRHAQFKIKVPLELYQTAEIGWGVRSLVDLPHGAFICTYVGELITHDEANERKDDTYHADLDLYESIEREKRNMGLLLDDEGFDEDEPRASGSGSSADAMLELSEMDMMQQFASGSSRPRRAFSLEQYFGDQPLFTVDANREGNIGRFLNHSCDPNVALQHVFFDSHDVRLPHVAFFTKKFTKAGEPLCWDYGYEIGSVEGKRIVCKCGTKDCQVYLL
ncbi:putative histone-lysine N-methyltransferase met-2 [Aphelenchoides avenae]|nr:putative histone-lysine N-methyltransferase met-2 [Aphelenchus avenae]